MARRMLAVGEVKGETGARFAGFEAALSSEEAPARINNRLSHAFSLRAYEMLLCNRWCEYSGR